MTERIEAVTVTAVLVGVTMTTVADVRFAAAVGLGIATLLEFVNWRRVAEDPYPTVVLLFTPANAQTCQFFYV